MSAGKEQPKVTLHHHMITDVGMVRDHNEDAAYVDDRSEFFVVADGMGGHAAGEVASAMAVDRVRATLEDARAKIAAFHSDPTDQGRKELASLLEDAVRHAHQAVFERGVKETDKQGMGTTLDVALLAGEEAFIAHVGDSRTYLVRNGKASQITTDHTVAEVLVIEGKLSAEEAQISPLRTILVNAIGVAPEVGVQLAHLKLRRGDFLLLCSDGLHDYFPLEQELADRMSSAQPEASLRDMVELAKSRGGHDNITGIVVQVIEGPEGDHVDDTPVPPAPGDQEVDDSLSTKPIDPVELAADSVDDLEAGAGESVATVPLKMAASDKGTAVPTRAGGDDREAFAHADTAEMMIDQDKLKAEVARRQAENTAKRGNAGKSGPAANGDDSGSGSDDAN